MQVFISTYWLAKHGIGCTKFLSTVRLVVIPQTWLLDSAAQTLFELSTGCLSCSCCFISMQQRRFVCQRGGGVAHLWTICAGRGHWRNNWDSLGEPTKRTRKRTTSDVPLLAVHVCVCVCVCCIESKAAVAGISDILSFKDSLCATGDDGERLVRHFPVVVYCLEHSPASVTT